jgi:acetyltransferase-like isoleucine patch superfamily enzyme
MNNRFSGPTRFVRRVRAVARDVCGTWVRIAWAFVSRLGAIGPFDAAGRRFGRFGFGSIVCFPANTIMNERHIRIGEGTIIGPHVTLSAGMWPGQQGLNDTVLQIGDRCLIGRGSGIVAHTRVEIGNDVWTGHNVYITDQNHGYEDITVPISQQRCPPDRPVSIGDGSWLGFGVAVLPGSRIGRHVVIGANAVVTGEIPDYSVAVGSPARVVRRFVEGVGWIRVDPRGVDVARCQDVPEMTHR